MNVRIGLFILIMVLVLFPACSASGSDTNANISRDQAIQTIKKISNSAGEVDIKPYPELDKTVDNVRYYYIQVEYANKMAAAYYVDDDKGNVYLAIGGELDTENPLLAMGSAEADSILSDEASVGSGGVTEIVGTVSADLKALFDTIGMSAEQVSQKFGSGYKKVSVSYDGPMEGFLYSDRGINVAFGKNGKVVRIYCTGKIEINGVTPGMDFSHIQEKLGKTSFTQAWGETPVNTVYKLKYTLNGRYVVFFSGQKEGENSIMSIS